jgi:hypothetical protein
MSRSEAYRDSVAKRRARSETRRTSMEDQRFAAVASGLKHAAAATREQLLQEPDGDVIVLQTANQQTVLVHMQTAERVRLEGEWPLQVDEDGFACVASDTGEVARGLSLAE